MRKYLIYTASAIWLLTSPLTLMVLLGLLILRHYKKPDNYEGDT